MRPLILLPLVVALSDQAPNPPGTLVPIGGGQRLHVHCTGRGSPAVILESGTGDISVIWSLVQPGVARTTRVCSYDRGGYAWSDPGTEPRTFAQLSLELHTALAALHVDPPYVLVGQSYGAFVVRGFARAYRNEVAGMVLVDPLHEDQYIVYGGAPHRIRDQAQNRTFPAPRIALDTAMVARARAAADPAPEALEPPLDRLPALAQQAWKWAASQPLLDLARSAELDWSPEELARLHQERADNRASLGAMPLVVLARTDGGYDSGLSMSADSLEKARRFYMADLAALSSHGRLVFAEHSGHNIHLEAPALVIDAIGDVVAATRGR